MSRFFATIIKPAPPYSIHIDTLINRKTAIVLMNMGGPKTLDQVHPFLLRLFQDKDLIPLPFQKYLAPLIAKRRTPKIIDQYSQIGGGSPITEWTEKQGELLTAKLDVMHPENEAPHKHYIAFRYAPPLTFDTVAQMKQDGVKRAVALSMYPQYSCSTTGSSLNELHASLLKLDADRTIEWSVIDRWATQPGLINAFTNKIKEALEKYPVERRSKVVLLFSAHSLPMVVVDRGDPYPAEVASTVNRVMENLGNTNPYRLVWQSQVGPKAWLGPKTEFSIIEYGKKGFKDMIVVPIAFVSDHVETLYEIDLEYGEVAKEHGVTGFTRAESLNSDDTFIAGMADLVSAHMASDKKCSVQLGLRCPGCINEKCGPAKEYFAAV